MTIRVEFYQKTGCGGNRQQLHWLREAGLEPEVKDLAMTPWTAERLQPFLAGLAVADWFNTSAPAVRDGLIRPAELSADEAMALILARPLLVRRPLIRAEAGHQAQPLYQCGFDLPALLAWLGMAAGVVEQMPASVGQCQKGVGHSGCHGHHHQDEEEAV